MGRLSRCWPPPATARAPLDLDLPERKILLDGEGRVERVTSPERLEAHRLIEEFMIQANVAAAETLEARRAPVVYRVHDAPSKEKLSNLREFLRQPGPQAAGRDHPACRRLQPRAAARAKSLPATDLVNEVVLRSQAQAVYAAANLGHFGLNLRRYAHFTSPIRRYADLLVHRSLIRALGPGRGRHGRRGGGTARPTSPRPSRTPSAAPWRPSARPTTG